jgi:hypothetical protein
MTRALALVMLVACKSGPSPAGQSVDNRGGTATAPAVGGCKLTGHVVDAATNQPLVGATLVLDGGDADEEVVVSSGAGAFDTTTKRPPRELTIYYDNLSARSALAATHCGRRLKIAYPPGPRDAGQIASATASFE